MYKRQNDVCTSRDSNGKPIAVLSGGAQAVAERLGVQEVAISLSFTGDLAIANALAITAESRPKPKEDKISERQVIAQSFREARSVLDELERVQEFEAVSYTHLDVYKRQMQRRQPQTTARGACAHGRDTSFWR